MKEKNKKKWVQPELTVLVRRKPEEGILDNCKSWSQRGDPSDMVDKCYYDGASQNCAGMCHTVATT